MITAIISFLIVNYFKILFWYVVGGITYSFFKWVIMVLKLRNRVVDIDENTVNNFKSTRNAWKNKANSEVLTFLRDRATIDVFGHGSYPPKATDNKGNLLNWAIFWPINLPYTLLADVSKTVFKWIQSKVASMYNAIATSILPK